MESGGCTQWKDAHLPALTCPSPHTSSPVQFSFNNNRVEDPKVPGTLKSSAVDVELAFAISPKANATACSYSKGKNNTATIFYPEP